MKNKHIDSFENFKMNEGNNDNYNLSLIGGETIYKNENLEVREITEFSDLCECSKCGCYWAVCHNNIFFDRYKERYGTFYLLLIDGYPEYLTQKGFSIFDIKNNVVSPHGVENLYLQYPGLEDIIG